MQNNTPDTPPNAPPEKKKDLFDKAIDAVIGLIKSKKTPAKNAAPNTDNAQQSAPAKASPPPAPTGPVLAPIKQAKKATNKDKSPANALSKAYITAFLVIAVVSLAIHMVASQITTLQQNSIENIYTINQERIIIAQIADTMKKHRESGQRYDFTTLTQALGQLEKNHVTFQTTALNSPVLSQLMFANPHMLDESIKAFYGQAKTYTEYGANDRSKAREDAYEAVITTAPTLLIPLLNQALIDFQNETLSQINKFNTLQLVGLIAVLLTLVGVALFVFHPLTIRIKTDHSALMRQALQDPLTKLNNRRAFTMRVKAQIERAKTDNATMVIALIDLDNFKSIKNTYSYDIRDKVLKHFARILKKSSRAGDVVGRIDGEEFAIMLPDTDQVEGKEILDNLVQTIAGTPCPYRDAQGNNATLNYTISIGYTAYTGNDIDDLFRQSDHALHAAKDQGCNRAVFAG